MMLQWLHVNLSNTKPRSKGQVRSYAVRLHMLQAGKPSMLDDRRQHRIHPLVLEHELTSGSVRMSAGRCCSLNDREQPQLWSVSLLLTSGSVRMSAGR